MDDYPRKRIRKTRKRFEIPLNVRQTHGPDHVSHPIIFKTGAARNEPGLIIEDNNNDNSILSAVLQGDEPPNVLPPLLREVHEEPEESNSAMSNTCSNDSSSARSNENHTPDHNTSTQSEIVTNSNAFEQADPQDIFQLELPQFGVEQSEDRLPEMEDANNERFDRIQENAVASFSSPFDRWSIILAVFLVTGSVHFTRHQYDYLRLIIMCMKETTNISTRKDKLGRLRILDERGKVPRNMLPSSSTVYRVLKPCVEKHLGTRYYDVIYNRTLKNYRKAIANERIRSRQESTVRIIPGSEHARMDVSFPPFLKAAKKTVRTTIPQNRSHEYNQLNMEGTCTPGLKHWGCVDDWPLIANREECFLKNGSNHARRKQEHITPWKTLDRAYIGDKICFKMKGNSSLSNDLLRLFNRRTSGNMNVIVGEIAAIGISTTVDEGLSINLQSRREVSVPEYILHELNKNLRETGSHTLLSKIRSINRRQQLFGSGDTLAVIHPEGKEDAFYDFIVLVNRFNVPNGEFDEHIFRITTSQSIDGAVNIQLDQPVDCHENVVADVTSVEVMERSADPLPSPTAQQVGSTFGTLQDGRRYFVYRFILFWDGFIVGSTSMEGIYCLSINLPTRYRSTSSAGRVLSLLPETVPSSVVFKELLNDIKTGMTTGFEDYDAEGNKVTVFLDMVACVGDTPALNEVIDVRGHNAIACCHICRFRRVTNEKDIKLGKNIELSKPRYMGTEVHGGISFASRSFTKHGALRALKLDEDTLKRMGMKESDSFPFDQFTEEFRSISSDVPLTSSFVSVVPAIFDNYRGLLIGPDHLVFGLAKDCINVVLSLLPKESYISEFEEIALSSLRQARLRTQGKLVNMQKKTLFSMTISEVFALLQISEYCFHVSVMKNERLQLSSNATTVSELCKKTIKVLGSLAAVAARLWFTPRLDEDGKEIVREFNNVHGTTYLRKTQTIIHDHIKLMREVASYDDEEAREYHSLKGTGGNVLQKKRKIEKSLRETNIVLKMLDKPNVHRLLELAYFMLPMVGSATRIAELEFERGHQAMKRAVENSNQHQPPCRRSLSCDL